MCVRDRGGGRGTGAERGCLVLKRHDSLGLMILTTAPSAGSEWLFWASKERVTSGRADSSNNSTSCRRLKRGRKPRRGLKRSSSQGSGSPHSSASLSVQRRGLSEYGPYQMEHILTPIYMLQRWQNWRNLACQNQPRRWSAEGLLGSRARQLGCSEARELAPGPR